MGGSEAFRESRRRGGPSGAKRLIEGFAEGLAVTVASRLCLRRSRSLPVRGGRQRDEPAQVAVVRFSTVFPLPTARRLHRAERLARPFRSLSCPHTLFRPSSRRPLRPRTAPGWSMIPFPPALLRSLLFLWPLQAYAANFTFSYSKATQCDDFQISWQGMILACSILWARVLILPPLRWH